MIKFYNTLSRKKEIFKPIKRSRVGFYACGPTVYWFAHIGNLRTYLFNDILRRVLEYNNYKVKQIINITDVGHLTSDSDTGEDKVEKEAKKEKKTALQITKFYTDAFKKDIKSLNIKFPILWTKATDYIQEQIGLIKKLEKKGFTYKISDGIYFDTSKIKDYGKLAGSKKRKLKAGARVVMVAGKKNPTDFALWKFTPAGTRRQMEWDSPWAPPGVRGKVKGFPGWHTECVAMAAKNLGVPFDIHTGGIDHISIHHTNELAQSEALFCKNLANFWLHGEFLDIQSKNPTGKPSASYGAKMAKSEKNIVLINDLIKKGLNPLAYRYLCLTAHYRSKINFSWEALKASQNALEKIQNIITDLKSQSPSSAKASEGKEKYQKRFIDFINDDLDTPKALALMWEVIKNKNITNQEKYEVLLDFDKVFGFGLDKIKKQNIPQEVEKLAAEREKYRQQKNWQKSDEIRQKIKDLGYQIEDTEKGPVVKPIANNK